MKINVEFDLTPAEFRQSLGLPDVEAFQHDLMARIQQQMEAGVEGYDPWSLMQPFLQQGMGQSLNQGLTQSMANFGNYQQMLLDMLRQAGGGVQAGGAGKQQADKGTADDGAAKASASARSRQNRKS